MPKKSEIRLVYECLNANKPMQVGNTYCSPACGHGCKLANYRKAVRGAAALQKKLKGNWKARVFEKLGWHFDASSGPLTVVGDYHGPHKSVRYTCYLEGHLAVNASYATPQEAVAKVLHHCSSSAARGLTVLELAYKAAGKEDEFLGWLRHACPSLARRTLGDGSEDIDGGWSSDDEQPWSEPRPNDHEVVVGGKIDDAELASFLSRLNLHINRKKPR